MATVNPESFDSFEFFHAQLFSYMLNDIKKAARVNGITLFSYEYLDPDSSFFQLLAGTNTIGYNADSGAEYLNVHIEYKMRYLGV